MKRAARAGEQVGQTAVEYLGMLLLVAVLVGALARSDVSTDVAAGVQRQLCLLVSGEHECDRQLVADDRARDTARTPDAPDLAAARQAAELGDAAFGIVARACGTGAESASCDEADDPDGGAGDGGAVRTAANVADELSGFKDARGAAGAFAEGDVVGGATSAPFALPGVGKLAKGAKAATKAAPRAGASALEDASRASFKAAEGPINISRKHLPGAGGRYNKFAEGVDADGVVREALRSPNAIFRPNPAGGYRVDTDLGRAIGQGGRTSLRSIVSPDGRVVTAFPYGPKTP